MNKTSVWTPLWSKRLIVEGKCQQVLESGRRSISEKQTQRTAEATQAKGDFGTKWSMAEENWTLLHGNSKNSTHHWMWSVLRSCQEIW
jgi:hypothetical protein